METTTRPLKIGVDIHHSYVTKKGTSINRLYSYNLLKKDYPENWDGWVDILVALPLPFDLVHLATKELKVMPGWWNGLRWEAIGLKKEDKVAAWKYKGDNS